MTIQEIKPRRRAAGEDGFTLIELLVVIIILGILAAVVVFAVGGVGDKGNRAACVIDTRTLRTALEANFAQFGTYTANPQESDGGATGPGTTPGQAVIESQLVSNGLLSEESPLHSAEVIDLNSASPGITQGIRVLVQDGSSPGGDCGNPGVQTGTCGTGVPFGTPCSNPENV